MRTLILLALLAILSTNVVAGVVTQSNSQSESNSMSSSDSNSNSNSYSESNSYSPPPSNSASQSDTPKDFEGFTTGAIIAMSVGIPAIAIVICLCVYQVQKK